MTAREAPRVPFSALIERGLVAPGIKLVDAKRRHRALVRADGALALGEAVGSIHRIGALAQGLEACNGWTFWHVETPKGLTRDRYAAGADARGDGRVAANRASRAQIARKRHDFAHQARAAPRPADRWKARSSASPCGAARLCRKLARDIDRKFEREMREDVAHDAGTRRHATGAFGLGGKSRRAASASSSPKIRRPFGGRHFGHAAEQTLGRPRAAPAKNRPRERARKPRRGASAPSRFGTRRGNVPPRRPYAPHSFRSTGKTRRPGFFGVQMVAPRSIIACAKSPARRGGVSSRARRRSSGLAAGSGVRNAKAARPHARYCRRPASPAHRRRSLRSRPRYIRRCRGARAARLRSPGNSPPWRSTTARAQACRLRARA